MAKEKTHKLVEPIMVDGQQYDQLTFRRIKGKDLRDMDRQPGTIDKSFFMIARLAGLPPEAIDEMDGEDIDACSRIVEGFMGRRQK